MFQYCQLMLLSYLANGTLSWMNKQIEFGILLSIAAKAFDLRTGVSTSDPHFPVFVSSCIFQSIFFNSLYYPSYHWIRLITSRLNYLIFHHFVSGISFLFLSLFLITPSTKFSKHCVLFFLLLSAYICRKDPIVSRSLQCMLNWSIWIIIYFRDCYFVIFL